MILSTVEKDASVQEYTCACDPTIFVSDYVSLRLSVRIRIGLASLGLSVCVCVCVCIWVGVGSLGIISVE